MRFSRFGKVCFEAHEIRFVPQNPCRMLGWSYSKVVIPIADFHTPFFFFVFIGIGGEKKKADKSLRTYRLRVG